MYEGVHSLYKTLNTKHNKDTNHASKYHTTNDEYEVTNDENDENDDDDDVHVNVKS